MRALGLEEVKAPTAWAAAAGYSSVPVSGSFTGIQQSIPLSETSIHDRQLHRFVPGLQRAQTGLAVPRSVGTAGFACEMTRTQRRFHSALNDPLTDALQTDLAKLQAEVEGMKERLMAMEAVAFKQGQVPKGQEGFAEFFESYGIEERKAEIRAQIARIDAHRVRIDVQKADIRALRTQGNETPRLTNAAQLLEHCVRNLPRRNATKTEGRLSRLVKAFDTDRLEREIRNCVGVVADSMCKRDKESHPQPVVIGTAGQGKTEVLYWITGQYPDAVDGPSIMANGPSIIREEFATKFEGMDPDPICLFATFHQSSTFDRSELNDIQAVEG